MSVFDLKKGESGKITVVAVDGAAGERLRSLGFKRGQIVEVLSFSLFKGSILLGVGYTRVAVRKSVAEKIEVEKVV